MKKLLIFLAITFFISCGNENSSTIEVQKLEEVTTPIDTLIKSENVVPEKKLAPKEISLEDFPKKWLELSANEENKEEYIIYDPCEVQLRGIEIIKNGDGSWEVFAYQHQDTDTHILIAFEATEETVEQSQVVYGMFILENPYTPDLGVETYSFTWNKDKVFCTFEGFFSENFMAVSKENSDNYRTVEENCDYLNGEQ